MKNILFILSLILWCSCSNEMMFDTDTVDVSSTTRATTSDKTYNFSPIGSTTLEDIVISPKGDSSFGRTLNSYVESNGVKTLLQPEIVSKPSWLIYCICFQYYDIFVLSVVAADNTSSERSGTVVLRQPESDKTLSVRVTQNGINNNITLVVNRMYVNRYMYTATANYPVKGETRVRVPLIVYNDGGELTHEAVMYIPKGERTGSYIMDWTGSPLVAYHGDIKGYRLYEGSIYGDDTVYTYSFVRYW